MRTVRWILLPILGAIAAIVAFKLASPFESTLSRPGLELDDPRALFTFGTTWGAVNRVAFGALFCGSMCLALTYGRRSNGRFLMAGGLGALLGGLINCLTDSSSDLLGIAISSKNGQLGSLIASLAWCVFVPAGIAFTIAFSVGITPERIKRAIFATKIAAVASFVAQILGEQFAHGPAPDSIEQVGELMRSQIPVWRAQEIAVGIALGLTMAFADEVLRAGSLRLIHGRNEFRDWSLDHATNRIGSAEGCEIPIFGFQGVQPVHALVVHQGPHFFLDPQAPTWLNGQPAGQVALNDGDVISVGSAQLVFSSRGYVGSAVQAVQRSEQFGRPTVSAAPVVPIPMPVSVSSQARLLFGTSGQEMRLPPGRYGVGRDSTNTIRLADDSSISRHHAEFLISDAGATLIDLGSKNGTILNGTRLVGQAQLKPGDVAQFGTATFTYVR